jgi:hypothetical protein
MKHQHLYHHQRLRGRRRRRQHALKAVEGARRRAKNGKERMRREAWHIYIYILHSVYMAWHIFIGI